MDPKLLLLTGIAFLSMFFAVFWLLTLLEGRHKIKKDPKPKKFPNLSVIAPAYNEEKGIEKCINSLLSLEYPGKIQVIVVDDGSKDSTYEKAKSFGNKITLITKKNGGKSSAINEGLKHVKYDYVVVMDADSIVSKKALYYMMGYFDDPEVAAVTPALKIQDPKSITQKVQVIEYLVNILQRKLYALLDIIFVTPGPFSVYKKKVIKEAGGFSEDTLTEDMDLALSIQNLGYKIENSVKADVYTDSPLTMYQLFNQRVRWYRGMVQNMKKYKHMLGSKKYGLLGRFLLPITIIMVFVALIASGLFMVSLAEGIYDTAFLLWRILTVGFVLDLTWDWTSFFLYQNVMLLGVAVTVLLTAIITMYISFRVTDEKMGGISKVVYLVYLAVYFLLLSTVWMMSIIKELIGAEKKW